MTPQRIPRTDNHGVPVKERATDASKRAKVEGFLEDNWRTIVTVAMVAGGWWAAHVSGPIQAIPAIIARDSARATEVTRVTARVDGMERAIIVLSRIQCFSLDVNDRVKYDIDCSRIPLPVNGGTTSR